MRLMRNFMRVGMLALIAGLFLGAAVQVTRAQDDPNFENGLKAFGSYHGGNIDTINLMNGALNVDIPIISYPQRGGKLQLNFVLHYHNSGNWWDRVDCNPYCSYAGQNYFDQGWGVIDQGVPGQQLDCGNIIDSQYNFHCIGTITMPDGAVHQMLPESNMTTWQPFDGSGFQMTLGSVPNLNNTQQTGGTLIDTNGVRSLGGGGMGLGFGENGGVYSGSYDGFDYGSGSTTGREDTNGNKIQYSSYTYTPGWTDTMGRAIPLMTKSTNSSDFSGCSGPLTVNYVLLWNPPGINGGTYPIKFCYVTIAVSVNFGYTIFNQAPYELQSVVLPDGTTWTFQYTTDGNGDLSQITFPTGGTLSYTWVQPAVLCTNQTHFYVFTRAVATRTLNPNDGVTPTGTWAYSYTTPSSAQYTTIVSTPPVGNTLGNDAVHTFTEQGAACQFYETQTQYYQGSHSSGTLLKTVNTSYSASHIFYLFPNTSTQVAEVLPGQTTTAWANGQQNKEAYTYDTALTLNDSTFACALNGQGLPVNGNAIGFSQYNQNPFAGLSYGLRLTAAEYDYGSGAPGPLLRTTSTSYLALSNSTYMNNNLLGLASTIQVTDGGGTQRAYSSYTYDDYSLASSGITTQHDSSPPAGTARGNQTKVSRWLQNGGAVSTTNCAISVSSGGYLTSYAKYYDTGMTYQSTDACGQSAGDANHTTTYAYSSTYAGAYPTTVTNALSQSASTAYDFNTGLVMSATDANSKTTSNTYDNQLRLTQVSYPDNGLTTFSYPNPNEVDISEKIDTSPKYKTSQLLVDGLGREIRAVTTNGETSPYDQSDTCYNAAGQVGFKAYAYQGSGLSASRVCSGAGDTFFYEGLGRTAITKHSDASTAYNFYSGGCSTVVDEQGKTRKSCSDGLGRLTEVDELGPSTDPTPGTGSATVSGTEQTAPAHPATGSSGTWSITGTYQSSVAVTTTCNDGQNYYGCTEYDADNGYLSMTINGRNYSVNYSSSADTSSSLATALRNAINGDSGAYVTASGSGSNIILASKTTGSNTNYAVSLAAQSNLCGSGSFGQCVGASPSFSWSGPANLSGGTDASGTIYDTGTVRVTVNGFQASATYGQGSTPAAIANAIANVFNGSSASPVMASVSGSAINLTAILPGTASNYSLSCSSSTSQPSTFSQASFTASCSGANLTGGTNVGYSSAAPNVTLYTYDTLNNLTCAVQKGTDTTAFTSCGASPLAWRPRSFAYDSLSRRTSAANPESGTRSPAYDADGNVVSETRPAPNQTGSATVTLSYCYDKLNRTTSKAYTAQSCPMASPVATYSYDQTSFGSLTITNGIGRRTSMTDAAGSEAWSFDSMGRILTHQRTTNSITKSMTAVYNLIGDMTTLNYPSGRTITYSYSVGNSPTSAVDSVNSINYAASVHYGASGAPCSAVFGGAVTTTWTLNSRLQPLQVQATTSGAPGTPCATPSQTGNLFDLTYNYSLGAGDNGNVAGITNNRDNTRSQTYTYDALNRVATAQTTSTYSTSAAHCWGESFNYDSWANLLSIGVSNTAYNGCTQENLSVSTSTNNQIPGFCYDAAGNLLAQGSCPGSPPYTYNYNAENQLTSTAGVTYTYDGDGERVEKSNGKIYWYGSSGQIWEETDLTGSTTNSSFYEYVFFGGLRLARRDSAGNVYYYLPDHLGTTRGIAEIASGQSTASLCYDADYYPFGGERAPIVNTCSQNYKFTGKERDAESGLDNFGARYDSSQLGRFMSADDPFIGWHLEDPQSLNLYSYVQDNPLNLTDPTGHVAPGTGTHATCVSVAVPGNKEPACGTKSGLDPDNANQARHAGETMTTQEVTAAKYAAEGKGSPGQSQKGGSVLARVKEGGEAVLNLGIGVSKAVGADLAAGAAPDTVGASGLGAAYLAVSSAGNFTASGIQLVGAVLGKTEETEKAASVVSSITTVSGFLTLIATHGDVDKASRNAAIEGVITSNPRDIMSGSPAMRAMKAVDYVNTIRDAAARPKQPDKP